MMFTLYLRKESTIDSTGLKRHFVAYYKDEAMKELKCKNFNQSRPDKRNKYTMYNCEKYKVVWLPDMD